LPGPVIANIRAIRPRVRAGVLDQVLPVILNLVAILADRPAIVLLLLTDDGCLNRACRTEGGVTHAEYSEHNGVEATGVICVVHTDRVSKFPSPEFAATP
jgi:hypothetical protein